MKPTTVASLALALLAPLALPQSAGGDGERAATVQDVEVLRRLLVEALDQAARPEPEAPQSWRAFTVPDGRDAGSVALQYSAFANLLGQGRSVSHARGYHLPGQGALFTLDVQVPVRRAAQRPAPDSPASDEGLDEWERVQRELAGGERRAAAQAPAEDAAADGEYRRALGVYRDVGLVQYMRVLASSSWELDPEAIARVRQAVLTTLERHGARVRGLRGDEGITVALHLSAASDAYAPLLAQGADTDPATGYWNVALADSAAQRVPARRLVVRVRRADLDGLRPGELAGRAQVHEY